MIDWTTIALVLGSNLIVAGVSFWATQRQVKAADENLSRQLQMQREVYERDRKREVRSDPLLRLRAELARMATKQERAIGALHLQHTRFGCSEEQAKDILKEAANDWNDYVSSGDWERALFTVDDKETVDAAIALKSHYAETQVNAECWLELSADEKKKTRQAQEDCRTEIVQVQSLITRRLEGL